LRAETKLPIIAVMPKDDKLTRLAAVSPFIEAGKLQLFKASWNDMLVSELVGFPNGKHDDMVDALSQFLSWKKTRVSLKPSIRKL
jgi:predicted phage terminase large subunit-like protein